MALGHHTSQCKVCKHPAKDRIEQWITDRHTYRSIADEFTGVFQGVDCHLNDVNLINHVNYFPQLRRARMENLTAVLDTTIEKALEKLGSDDLKIRASDISKLVECRAKLAGDWVDVTRVIADEFPDRTKEQIEVYAMTGKWKSDAEAKAFLRGKARTGGRLSASDLDTGDGSVH